MNIPNKSNSLEQLEKPESTELLSQNQIEKIMQYKFDFASLNKCIGEFKKSIWKIEKADSHMKQQRVKHQNVIFKLMQQEREQDRQIF